jgi:flagellar biosynthetic protein FlhB
MAEQADRESRTEEPTEKKIVDEVEKGNIPVSGRLLFSLSRLPC